MSDKLQLAGYAVYFFAAVIAAIAAIGPDHDPTWILVGLLLWIIGLILIFSGLFLSWKNIFYPGDKNDR